jgi:hypothetical protein
VRWFLGLLALGWTVQLVNIRDLAVDHLRETQRLRTEVNELLSGPCKTSQSNAATAKSNKIILKGASR